MCADPKDQLIAKLREMLNHKEIVTRELCQLIAKLEREITAAKVEGRMR